LAPEVLSRIVDTQKVPAASGTYPSRKNVIPGSQRVQTLQDRSWCNGTSFVLFIEVSFQVSGCQGVARHFQGNWRFTRRVEASVQSGYGCVAYGPSSGSLARSVGNGACSFLCIAWQDVQDSGCRPCI